MSSQHFSLRHSAVALILLCAPVILPAADPANVGNFHKINDHVYRGAQPTPDGFANLAHLGIKTIVDLREPGGRSLAEQKTVEAAGMRYLSFPLAGMSAPPPATVAKILALLDDPSVGPIFIHCRRGADRTGTILACYRIAHDHWDNQKALAEAKNFGMSWTERAMKSYVLHYSAGAAATGPAAAAVQ